MSIIKSKWLETNQDLAYILKDKMTKTCSRQHEKSATNQNGFVMRPQLYASRSNKLKAEGPHKKYQIEFAPLFMLIVHEKKTLIT